MAAGSDTNELMRMLNQGQEELKRSMRNLSALTGPVNDKKTLHKLHPTPYRPTRKRARTQQLTPNLVKDSVMCYVVCILYKAGPISKAFSEFYITSRANYTTKKETTQKTLFNTESQVKYIRASQCKTF